MRQWRRYGRSAEQKADKWQPWKLGESLHEIGRAFGKNHGSIQFLLAQHGGIAPAVRCRSQRTLTLAEREEISRVIAWDGRGGIGMKQALWYIADNPSVIWLALMLLIIVFGAKDSKIK